MKVLLLSVSQNKLNEQHFHLNVMCLFVPRCRQLTTLLGNVALQRQAVKLSLGAPEGLGRCH
jgi:hypothetical protein